jgi:hypothetical protein
MVDANTGEVLSDEELEVLGKSVKEKVTILYDGEPIELADNYDDIMNPDDDDGAAEYLAVVGADGVEVLVSIPHFSPHSITIISGEQKPVSQPGFGFSLAVMLVYSIYRRRD